MDVGLRLGLLWAQLIVIKNDYTICFGQKPLHMLQAWKEAAGENFTYKKLASALEKECLNTSALNYCYEQI